MYIGSVSATTTWNTDEPTSDPEYIDMAYGVMTDHIRTLCFAISDGAVPSYDGRGHVLRRILLRAIQYSYQHRGATIVFFGLTYLY